MLYTIKFEDLTQEEVKVLHQILLQAPMGAVEKFVNVLRQQVLEQDKPEKENG